MIFSVFLKQNNLHAKRKKNRLRYCELSYLKKTKPFYVFVFKNVFVLYGL